MTYYKDPSNQVHSLDSPGFEYLLPPGSVLITPEEATSLIQLSAPVAAVTHFSSLDFLDRFTQAEQLSVVQATMVSAEVKLWYDRLLAADFVDLEDPRTEAGVDALIAAGLLDPSRKAEILTP